MKNKILITVFLLTINIIAKADYVRFMPIELTQPDKTIVQCFVTGDEIYRTVHDKDGYTIVQSDIDGYYYYAIKVANKLVPSVYKIGAVNPSTLGIQPWLKESADVQNEKVSELKNSMIQRSKSFKSPSLSLGVLTNIVIYVRLKDEPEFTKSRNDFSKILESTDNTQSLKNYFEEISYGKFSVKSEQYPVCDPTVTISYLDSMPRSYFQPYNAVTNTNGYTPESEDREQALIKRAIDAVSSQIPASIVVDADGDNYVDNVTIVVKGNADGWGKLLWPHKWSLYKRTANILGKRVGTYIFTTENMFNVKTMCHEMFHVVGAPDLYHYTDNGIDPAGSWDLMQSSSGHPLAYMKWKYSGQKWISSIPEITVSGEYSLKPITNPTNNCFKIKSPYSSSEYFVVEYRRKTGLYEGTLPQSGLIISRINTLASGNGNGPPDEVYVMRPQGSLFSNGTLSAAAFGDVNARPNFNLNSNPAALLTNQTSAGVNITDIRIEGDSVRFKIDILDPVILKSTWSITADSYENSGSYYPSRSFDNNTSTMWHTNWTGVVTNYPHWLKVDFRKSLSIKGIRCQPRKDSENGRIKDYDLFVSQNGTDWDLVASGTFPNNSLEQTVTFPEQNCRYVKLVAKNEVAGRSFASLAEFNVDINSNLMSRKKWKLMSASSYNVGYEPELAFDSIAKTIWHTKYTAPAATYPHEIAIDMNDTCSVDGLFYLPRQDSQSYGTIANYEFYTSLDGTNWTLIKTGAWGADKSVKINFFDASVCRYIKLVALSEINANTFASISELGVYGIVTKDIVSPNIPTNFRVLSREGTSLKLTWDKDVNDKSLLYYQIGTENENLSKVYQNEHIAIIDTTKTNIFTLKAFDGSGNASALGTLTYNALTGVEIPSAIQPIISSNKETIYLQNLNNCNEIRIYNAMGQLLIQRLVTNNSMIINHNYSGIGIVEIISKNKPVRIKKIIMH